MEKIKLTRVERWTLANQYRILAALSKGTGDIAAYNEWAEALERGYEYEYASMAEHVNAEPMSYEECDEVVEIMQMFRVLKQAYDALPDKTGIDPQGLTFRGFDGNEEPRQFGYALYFCKSNGGRFKELESETDGLNSHCPVLEGYRRKLAEWRKSANQNRLTGDDVRRIARA